MKKLILILFVAYASLVFASKLAPLEINTLETESVFIIIGKVEKTTLLEGNKDGAKNYKIDVNIISYLKGENNTKILSFSFWHGGLKGFNIIPKENTFWVFFIKSIDGDKAKLVHPSSMVEFEEPCSGKTYNKPDAGIGK